MEKEQIESIYHRALFQLVEDAHQVHTKNFKHNEIQASQLLSIKTGGCPENCSYCPQSAHYNTGVQKQRLMSIQEVSDLARVAKKGGATRFCMGAAWREVRDGKDFDHVIEIVKKVKSLDLEVCCTLGMLTVEQAKRLKAAGLYAYNHNIDTSREFYSRIISTRSYDERLQTIQNVRDVGITVCTGGIIGMGETDEDRVSFLKQLTDFSPCPESITVNTLVKTKGTPLENENELDPEILIRVIATARILMPKSMIRLSAGRNERTHLEQFLCFYVGANSIFFGEKLLTSPNPSQNEDMAMLKKLGLKIQAR